MTENNTIFESLKSDIFDEGTESRHIIREFSNLENCFGNKTSKLMENIISDETAFKNFVILVSACGIEMAYTWGFEESQRGHWDERNRASMQFCYENRETICKLFQNHAGFAFPLSKTAKNEGFFSVIRLSDCVLYFELLDFARTHSTLQQKMMGTFFRTLAAKGVVPDKFSTGFPFV